MAAKGDQVPCPAEEDSAEGETDVSMLQLSTMLFLHTSSTYRHTYIQYIE